MFVQGQEDVLSVLELGQESGRLLLQLTYRRFVVLVVDLDHVHIVLGLIKKEGRLLRLVQYFVHLGDLLIQDLVFFG